MYIIAGLGNPGAQYVKTRHNVGFMAIDILSQKLNIDVSKSKHKALIGEGKINGEKVILVKPQTYMNLSGESISEILKFYKVDINNLIVMYDDIDITVGNLRIRPNGSAGTHNGMKSIICNLNKQEFPRVRIGVGAPPKGWDLANYVLGEFPKEEQEIIFGALMNATDAVLEIVKNDVASAMNKYN